MLSVFSAIVLGASTFSVMAAESTSAQASASQQTRIEIDAKREQITGADKVELPAAKTSAALLDAPMDTEDAPDQTQEQQP
jgi:hemolysin activation/secretion protein